MLDEFSLALTQFIVELVVHFGSENSIVCACHQPNAIEHSLDTSTALVNFLFAYKKNCTLLLYEELIYFGFLKKVTILTYSREEF